MEKLKGKVAIITGGASGIGKASVKVFAEEGARVVLADQLDERGTSLAEKLGPDVSYIHADVSQESDVKAVIDHALKKFGRLDCMFNNAGIGGVTGMIEEIPVEGFDITIRVLLRSVFLGIKYTAPVMKKQGSGSIISTASVAGLRTGFAGHIYSAAKAAIRHMTRTVAMELGENNIRVNCICPGAILTEIFERALCVPPEKAESLIEILKVVFKEIQPISRVGMPEDIAKTALWLASDDSSFVNGHALVVDGGVIGGRKWSEVESQMVDLYTALDLGTREQVVNRVNEELSKQYA